MTPSSSEPSSPEGTPLEIEPFDPEIHVSPHALFRRLKDVVEGVGRGPRLVGLKGETLTPLAPLSPRERGEKAEAPSPSGRGGLGVRASGAQDTLLIDQDGRDATRRARELRAEGHEHVHALYGGLELYDYALDRHVVGEERFLVE